MKSFSSLFYFILLIGIFSVFCEEDPDQKSNKKDGKIVGGIAIDISFTPYQVFLSANGAWCGGSIISANLILTAAHCVYGVTSSMWIR
jgi:trypsin